jgi:hypothetical protein
MQCTCRAEGHDHKPGECEHDSVGGGLCGECRLALDARPLNWLPPGEATENVIKMRAEIGKRGGHLKSPVRE